MAAASTAMFRPGALDPSCYATQRIYDTTENTRTKKWSSRLKLNTSGSARSSEKSPESPYMYGTISAPGGSALSKSMKYAETWLYGSVRAQTSPVRPSVFTSYPEVPGPVLISTPQKPTPHNYAVILCSCPEYLNGTKKSSSTKVSICKKCKGSRLPLTIAESPRVIVGGTVRGPQINRDAGILRAGTVRVQSSKSRPSILKSQNGDNSDPYDLMRRSRLAQPQDTRIGSQFSTSRSRAKSISPCRVRTRRPSPPPDSLRKCRSKSVSRFDELWIEENSTSMVEPKKSILSCDVNPYDLVQKTSKHPKSLMEFEFDDHYAEFLNDTADTARKFNVNSVSNSNFKAISGQKIRIAEEHKTGDLSVYDPIELKYDLKNGDLKSQEAPLLPNIKNECKKSLNKNSNKKIVLNVPTSNRTKQKTTSPKRPPRRLRNSRMDDDSESDTQRLSDRVSNRRIASDVKSSKYKNQNVDNIKSILKKPKNYDSAETKTLKQSDAIAENKRNSSQFYLPKPSNDKSNLTSQNTMLQRKRVQFLVESDETKVIYTAEFNLSENTVRGIPGDINIESEDDVVAEGDVVSESLSKDITESTETNSQDFQNDSGLYEDVEIKSDCEIKYAGNNSAITPNIDLVSEKSLSYGTTVTNLEDNEVPKITILRRSESERVSISGTISPPRFLDTMALRPKSRHGQIHTSQIFVLNNHDSETVLGDKIQIDVADVKSGAIKNYCNNYDRNIEEGNLSDSSDITKEVLNDLRKNILTSPDPPPRTKSKERKSKKNNYVKTRFIRSNSTSSTSDEWSDGNDYEKKTVLRVQQFDSEHEEMKSNINESFYSDHDTRRTSIQINGNECYSTMNISNNDVPIYLSSVVVNDDYSNSTSAFPSGATVTISVGTAEKEIKRSKSKIYIGAELSQESVKEDVNTYEDFCINYSTTKEIEGINYSNSKEDITSILNDPVEAVRRNLIPHVCGKKNDSVDSFARIKSDQTKDEKNCSLHNKAIEKSGFITKLFDDPFFGHLAEGLDSDLVKKLIENSLIKLQETKIQGPSSNTENENTIENLIEISLKNMKKENISNETKIDTEQNTTETKEIIQSNKVNNTDKTISSKNEENGCSAPYESMEYESGAMGVFSDLEPMSDCYNASASELSTEDDTNSTRSKFYQMLVDAALCEIEIANNTDDDHHYESIRLNSDPIYEEICDMPPPLPMNPPPTSLSLLDDEKRSGSRSIFEGASKYDILSYLVDAKERGIDDEEAYVTTYVTENERPTLIEETKDKLMVKEIINNRLRSNTSQISNASDSSEDNSLIISHENIEKTTVSKKTSSEIERNDSGVGSETSKSSRSRLQGKTTPNDLAVDKDSPIHLCEDCDTAVETQITEQGTVYAPLVCRKCAKKRSERKEIITEIVETEEKYGRDLQIILEEFYNPMLVAGLLTQEQLSAIFLNVEELIENNQVLSEKLRDALEIAIEQGDEDLLTVNVGKILLECSAMLTAFQTYCVRQAGAALLLAGLEKEKELLRIFLRVSQMENTVLRRMNLNSFLMVPVQRVTKYPLLLSRLYRSTAACAAEKEDVKNAQRCVEARLEEMNAAAAAAAAAARDVPLWRRRAAARRTAHDLHVADIRLRKMAVDVLDWNHDDARFAMEGKLLFTQPNDNNWRKGRTIKLTPINALLVTNGKPTNVHKGSEGREAREAREAREGEALFARSGVREAALLLVREKAGRYTLQRDPLYLDRCVVAADHEPEHFFEVHEITTKDSYIFKAEESSRTRIWYRQLQFHAQGAGAWRKRRNALANIMINPMLTRN